MKTRFYLIILMSLLFSACGPKTTPTPELIATEVPPSATQAPTDTPTPTESPTSTPTTAPTATKTNTPTPKPIATIETLDYPPEGYGPVNFPDTINPLTGLPVDEAAMLDHRPVAIKISNYPRGIRPQWGLSLADHVFEYYHEGGLTRFIAIFLGNDVSEVGPIRSARFVDEHIVRMYKAFFAFGSADYRVRYRLYYSEFYNRLVSLSDIPCPGTVEYPLCRTDPNGWNHLMTDTTTLRQHFDGLHFNVTLPENGETADSITIRYSFGDYHKWQYDPTIERYVRYHDLKSDEGEGEVFDVLTDRLTGEPITAANVVLLTAKHTYYSKTPEMIEVNLSGYGEAYLFRDGQAFLVTWVRLGDLEIISLTDDEGNRFPLKPGNTWFEVVGEDTRVTMESPDWRFEFTIP
jgi:hypothetical protein